MENNPNDVRICMADESWCPLGDELSWREDRFFELVETCDLSGVEQFLAENRVNINMKNHQGITPLHLAIRNDCEPMVDLFLRQSGVRIGDSVLFAITNDTFGLLVKLLDHAENGTDRYGDDDEESEEFPPSMEPLVLAAQCGRYETVDYLLSRGHQLRRPHPPRCTCQEQCVAADVDVVAAGIERLNTYRALSSPTYLCRTSADDPILACFRLHDELLDRGKHEQVYETVYTSMALQVRLIAVNMVVNCRTSDEVKLLLRNRDGCEFGVPFPYPRLIAAMDHNQKEFVGHTNVQQQLESAWIGGWTEWRTYSTFRKCAYPAWRLLVLPSAVLLAVLSPGRDDRPPVKRMLDGALAYGVFLALLFAHSNADRFATRRGVPDSVPWALAGLFAAGHASEKIKLRLMLGPDRYFGDPWNVYDTAELTLLGGAYAAWAAAGFRACWADGDADRVYWHWADPQLVAEGLFAVATVMAYLRPLFLCQLSGRVGPTLVTLAKAVREVGKFAAFLAIITVAFACGLATLYAPYAGMARKDPDTGRVTRQQDSFVTAADTVRTLFWGVFRMTSLEAPDVVVGCVAAGGCDVADADAAPSHGFTQLVGFGLFAAFEVMTVVVMVNMLIAGMTATAERMSDDAEHEWLFARTKVYVHYMLLDDLPPPFNLLPTVTQIVRLARCLFTGFAANITSCNHVLDADDHRCRSEYRALMAELVKRFFVRVTQSDRGFA